LQKVIDEGNVSLVGVTETWASEDLGDGELHIEDFNTYRRDRMGEHKGGGVIMYVHESLRSTPYSIPERCDFQESVWCKIQVNDNVKILAGTIYRTQASTDESNYKLLKMLEYVRQQAQVSHLLIMGDFNLPEIDYREFSVQGPDSSYAARFFDTTQDLFLVQNVLETTRFRGTQHPSRLDYIFTNEEDIVDELRYRSPLGNSDHVGLLWKIKCSCPTVKTINHFRRAYWKGDYVAMGVELSRVDWDVELDGRDPEEAWSILSTECSKAIDRFIPLTKPRKKKKAPYMTAETKDLINKREGLYAIYKRTGRIIDHDSYKKIRNKVSAMIRRDKFMDSKKIIKSIGDNKKAFYRYVKSRQQVKPRLQQLKMSGGGLTENDEQSANELSEFFRSVFIKENTGEIPEMEEGIINRPTTEMDQFEISVEDVCMRLRAVKVDKSPGPDGMNPAFLKGMAEYMAVPMAMIFRQSLKEHKLPRDWKTANISPIFKKGGRSEPGNYRPVSLTSIPCKILESIIRDKMLKYAEDNKFMTAEQHGFTSKRSCLTNLLETLEDWTEALDSGHGLDVLYLDYQKAFDTVPHKRLLSKLKWYGFGGDLLSWISEFLVGRRMRVVVNGANSEWEEVLSGVPQGSVLGPLLFLLYVNDIPYRVKSKVKLFADDTKIWNRVSDGISSGELQYDLDCLGEWSEKWLLKFNLEKCHVMHVGHKSDTKYYLHKDSQRCEIAVSRLEKDLGIWVSDDLKWSTQCGKAAKKAMSVLGMIKRTFPYLDRDGFILLYNTYVRVHLEYCVQVWNPYRKKDILCLERVQRRATKMVYELKHLEYEERLHRLGLYTLEYRRKRGDLIETYKMLTGGENIDASVFFKRATYDGLRGNSMKLYKSGFKKTCRQKFFSQRVIDDWNGLPDEVVTAGSLVSFKKHLDEHCLRNGH
jgi:hypothetical protein